MQTWLMSTVGAHCIIYVDLLFALRGLCLRPWQVRVLEERAHVALPILQMQHSGHQGGVAVCARFPFCFVIVYARASAFASSEVAGKLSLKDQINQIPTWCPCGIGFENSPGS